MSVIKTGTSAFTATCDNCGKQILNIFEIGDKIYGSECIKKMTGAKADPRRMIMVEFWQDHEDQKAYLQKLQDADPLEF